MITGVHRYIICSQLTVRLEVTRPQNFWIDSRKSLTSTTV